MSPSTAASFGADCAVVPASRNCTHEFEKRVSVGEPEVDKSKFWKETVILVIEDDSALGLDHVDGHRTVALCVSPYTRRGAVVSENYNHPSFLRTMELVFAAYDSAREGRAVEISTNTKKQN